MATTLSFSEEQLWLAEQAGPLAAPFLDCAPSLSVVVRVASSPNCGALEASLNEIARRHEVLRSKFLSAHEGPVRLYGQWLPVGLTTVDLRHVTDGDGSDLVTRVLAHHVKQPFDLARGALFRACLIALPDDEHLLAITVHHIVFDRWSKRVLARELKLMYAAYATGRTPVLEPLPVQYRDYVRWQREQLAGDLGRSLTEYWTARLSALTDLALPCDGDRERVPSGRSGHCWFTIPTGDVSRLDALSRRCRVTVATVMLAIFKLFLYRASGIGDLAVGVPMPDRRRPEFEPLIGLFMNVLVVRTTITRDVTFLDLLDRVRRALVDACRYQDLPYGYLLQVIGAPRPLYRVAFNFMPRIPASDLELPGLQVRPVAIATEPRSQADLSLHVRYDSGALVCRLVYSADLFSCVRVQHFAAQLRTLVTAVLNDPRKHIAAYTADEA